MYLNIMTSTGSNLVRTLAVPGFNKFLTVVSCICLLGTTIPRVSHAQDYAIGADLSFMKMAEDQGLRFKEDGTPRPGLQIFKDHGYNWIRLRLFHTPTRLPNDLAYMNMCFDLLEMEKRELDAELSKLTSPDKSIIEQLYHDHMRKFEENRNQLTLDTNRGSSRLGMLRWNETIEKSLGVNNLSVFKLMNTD